MLGALDTMAEVQMIPAWQKFDCKIQPWTALYSNLVRFEAHHRDKPSISATSPRKFDLVEKIV